eukprot:3048868-Amphidinium_carterae.1
MGLNAIWPPYQRVLQFNQGSIETVVPWRNKRLTGQAAKAKRKRRIHRSFSYDMDVGGLGTSLHNWYLFENVVRPASPKLCALSKRLKSSCRARHAACACGSGDSTLALDIAQ